MPTNIQIKVCGLTTIEEIEQINDLPIDYVGFVFAPSKRQITAKQAKTFRKRLNPRIKTVGVFVNETIGKVNEIADVSQLDIVQLHGNEPPSYCAQVMRPIWKSLSVATEKDVERHLVYLDVAGILLDTLVPGIPGGSGKAFNWDLGKDIPRDNIILAGGLSPANVGLASQIIRPQIVDVSSGVETNGMKDREKIKDFIRSVKEYG